MYLLPPIRSWEAGFWYHVDGVVSTEPRVCALGTLWTSQPNLTRLEQKSYPCDLESIFSRLGDRGEFQTLDIIGNENPSHLGYRRVRTALDIFELQRPGGRHFCLVQPPMWESWKDLLRRNETGRFLEPLLKAGLRHLFLALDYLHSKCKLVHTGMPY